MLLLAIAYREHQGAFRSCFLEHQRGVLAVLYFLKQCHGFSFHFLRRAISRLSSSCAYYTIPNFTPSTAILPVMERFVGTTANCRKPRSHDLGFLQFAVVPKVIHTYEFCDSAVVQLSVFRQPYRSLTALPQPVDDAIPPGENRALAAACNRLVVVDGVVDHGVPLTFFQSTSNDLSSLNLHGE